MKNTATKLAFIEEKMSGDLFDKIKSSVLNDQSKVLIAKQLILYLQELHSQKIYHRDIKSENILLDENNNPKLTDFGLSSWINNQEVIGFPLKKMCGSLRNMSPNLLNFYQGVYGGDKVKEEEIELELQRADWWAMGVLVYSLATGKPFIESKKNEGKFLEIMSYLKLDKLDTKIEKNVGNIELREIILDLMLNKAQCGEKKTLKN